MQLNLSEYSDNFLLQLLANDLINRNKDVRYSLIIDRIIEKIVIAWIAYAHANRLFNKPVKCVVRFVENENDSVFEGKPFTLTATLDPSYGETDIENYVTRVRNALTFMRFDLCKHDLDKVEFDTDNETGRESIKFYEYHDITKGF